MARKGKNDNLRDTTRDQEGKKPPYKKKSEAVSTECPPSIGIMPYLLEPPTVPSYQGVPDTGRLATLRKLYKKTFGYKPVGKSEKELHEILASRGVNVTDI